MTSWMMGWKSGCHKFGFKISRNRSDLLVTKAQVHQCRVEHNIEPWIVIENPTGILFHKIKNYTVNTERHIVIHHTS